MREHRDDRRLAPSPEAMDEQAALARTTVNRVRIEYRWLVNASYAPSVAEEAKVRVSGRNDLVGGLVSSRKKQRGLVACVDAMEAVKDAIGDLKRAESRLLRALDQLDPAERPEQLRYPRTTSRDDLRKAKEAQERRKGRSEDVP